MFLRLTRIVLCFWLFLYLVFSNFLQPYAAFAITLSAATDVCLYTLPNGLRVLIHEQHTAPLVAIDIWVRAGSGQEKESESGVAHFLEHLVFKGTPTRKPGEIDAAIEDLGSLLNAGTTRDGTHFYTTVASRYLETALEVLADALQNATLSEEAIRHERAVILDEMARGRNDIQRRLFDRLHALLYPNHAYGRPVHGLVESLSILTRDTLNSFYRRFYVPNNTTVVLVGDLIPDDALAFVTKAFGTWARSEVPSPPPFSEPGSNTPRTVVETSSGSEAAIAMGFRINTGDNPREICMANVLSILLSDRIREHLSQGPDRPQSEPTVSIDYAPVCGPGLFALYIATEPTRLENARRLIEEELHRIQQKPVDSGLLEGAKRRAIGEHLYERETFGGQARLLGLFDIIGDYRTALEYPLIVAKITNKDILNFAKRYFNPSKRAEILIVPKEKP